jgi:hypothetical protein
MFSSRKDFFPCYMDTRLDKYVVCTWSISLEFLFLRKRLGRTATQKIGHPVGIRQLAYISCDGAMEHASPSAALPQGSKGKIFFL